MSEQDLTTVEAVRRYVGGSALEQENEVLLAEMIRSVSSTIREETGRRFSTPRLLEAREFYVRAYEDRLYVDELFAPSDIVSVATPAGDVVVYEPMPERKRPPKGTWLLFGGTQMSLPPSGYPPDHANWFVKNFAGGSPNVFAPPGRVIVTATYGYVKVPDDIEWRARQTIKEWYELGVEHFGRQFDASQIRQIVPEALPSSVASALKPYKHPDLLVMS